MAKEPTKRGPESCGEIACVLKCRRRRGSEQQISDYSAKQGSGSCQNSDPKHIKVAPNREHRATEPENECPEKIER